MASPPPVVEYAVFFTLAAVLIFLVGEYLAWVYRDQANSDQGEKHRVFDDWWWACHY